MSGAPRVLADAIGERRFPVLGVWGGSVSTERTRAVKSARAQDPDATEAETRELRPSIWRRTFESRLTIWEHMARHGVARRPASKRTVAVGVAWT